MRVSFQMIGRTVMYVFKRRIKNMLNSTISLPSVFAKMFEKILYQYFNIKLKMNFSLSVSLVFFQMILALCKSSVIHEIQKSFESLLIDDRHL